MKIKETHFNTVKLWAVWSWIERKEGEYYFEDLDEIIDLCQEIDLNVVINTIPEGMPYWLSRRHNDAKYTTSDGFTVEMSGAANLPSGGSPGLCPDKNEVLKNVCCFIEIVVERYSNRKNVIAFDVWNEPHLEPIFDYPDQLFCYCDHSKLSFNIWLKNKYKSIETINKAWMRAYSGWEDVLPPVRFGTYPDMMDWRSFWIENLGDWLRARVAATKKVARGKTVMTHVPFSGYIGGSGSGGLGYHLGDEFILAPLVEKFGLTSFPKWLMGNDYIQHLINIELIAAASQHKDFWQSELQAGAGKWEALGRSVATPDEIRLWNWSAIACGAKGIMYWQWNPEPSGMEAIGFGLTTLSGKLSARTRVADDCAVTFNRVEGFDTAHQLPVLNGIYISRTADLWWHAAFKGEPVYAKSLYGAYKACFDQGIPVRMVHGDQLVGIQKEDLKVLYLPAAVALSDEELLNLNEFVSAGGTLISEACPGLFDHHGVIRKDLDFLEEIFGLSDQELDHEDIIKVNFSSGDNPLINLTNLSGKYYRQDFGKIETGVKILARFEDGRPAIVEKKHEHGLAILVGTFVAVDNDLEENPSAAKFITAFMKSNGYSLINNLQQGKNVLLRISQNNENFYVCAVNYGKNLQKVHFDIAGSLRLKSESFIVELDKEIQSLDLSVNGQDGVLIRVEKA